MLAALLLAASLSSPNVTPWANAQLNKTRGVTASEIPWGYASSNGVWRLVDGTNVSTAAGLYSIPAAYFERAARCGFYDGYATRYAITTNAAYLTSGWAKEYTLGTNDTPFADLAAVPDSGRYMNRYGSERLTVGKILSAVANDFFAPGDFAAHTWSSRIPLGAKAFPSNQTEWTTSEPFYWTETESGSWNNAWLFAFPTFAKLEGAPFAANRTPYVSPLAYAAWTRLNANGWLGTRYTSDAASQSSYLMNWVNATWPSWGWLPPYGYTNALVTASGISDGDSVRVCARLRDWRTAQSMRTDLDALGALAWAVGIVDEVYSEPTFDTCTNATRTGSATWTAPIYTAGNYFTMRPGTADPNGIPVFVADSTIYAYRSSMSYSMTTSRVGSAALSAGRAGVLAHETPRGIVMTPRFNNMSPTNGGVWVVYNDYTSTGGFEYQLNTALSGRMGDLVSLLHADTTPVKLEITCNMLTWRASPWTVEASATILATNAYGSLTLSPESPVFKSATIPETQAGPFSASGTVRFDTSFTCCGPVPGSPILPAAGWPTKALFDRAPVDHVTAYGLDALVATTNALGVSAYLPYYADGDTRSFRAACDSANGYGAMMQMRTNRIASAAQAVRDAVTQLGTGVGMTYDADAAADAAKMRTLVSTADTTAFDNLLWGGVIPMGTTLTSVYGFLATNNVDMASERVYTAEISVDNPSGYYEIVFNSKSWEMGIDYSPFAYVTPQYVAPQVSTNYGGYACAALEENTVKTTFDGESWSALSVTGEGGTSSSSVH